MVTKTYLKPKSLYIWDSSDCSENSDSSDTSDSSDQNKLKIYICIYV